MALESGGLYWSPCKKVCATTLELCYAMLRYAAACCVVLCCVVLCCVVVLRCVVLRCAVLCFCVLCVPSCVVCYLFDKSYKLALESTLSLD